MFTKLNEEKRQLLPCSPKPSDVARVESHTFICCEKEEDAGPTNHWADPKEMKATPARSSAKGRTHVVPFSMALAAPLPSWRRDHRLPTLSSTCAS